MRIHVLDTAVRATHGDLYGRVERGWASGCADGACEHGYLPDGHTGAERCSSHGTMCASIAAGSTCGVATNATIVPVQVMSCDGYGSVASIIAGLEWAIDDGASMITLSLSGP